MTEPSKYSVILRFWNTPQEIEVSEIAFFQNSITKGYYYKFIDITGRLWENVPEHDVILIDNFPAVGLLEDFHRIRKEMEEASKKEVHCPRSLCSDISFQ